MTSARQAHSWSTVSQAVLLTMQGATLPVALPTAAVVGTFLSAVNQGHVLLAGDAGPVTWIRIAVNYATPFTVTSIGFLSARRVGPASRPTTTPQGSRTARAKEL